MKDKTRAGLSPLALVEEAFHLVRCAPASALAAYYTGSLPFILGLMFFWSDMSKRTSSDESCAQAALGMAVLFLWMKCWQTVYGQCLLAEIQGCEPAPWGLRRTVRMAVTQAVLQPIGFVLLPFALLVTIPFAWTYALFQNITVLGDGEELSMRAVARRCARLAGMWPWQNHLTIWILSPVLLVIAGVVYYGLAPLAFAALPESVNFFVMIPLMIFTLLLVFLCPFGLLVMANVTSALAIIPMLLRVLFGVESPFALVLPALVSPTFHIIAFGLAYLFLDPLLKAAYVLRCFYGESFTTGADLRVELRKYARAPSTLRLLLMGGVLMALCAAARADGDAPTTADAAPVVAPAATSVSPDALDHAISGVMEQRIYAWRLPKNELGGGEKGLLTRFVEAVAETLADWAHTVRKVWNRFQDWLDKKSEERARNHGADSSLLQWQNIAETLLYVLLAGLVCVAAALSWRAWQTRSRVLAQTAFRTPAPVPDIEDEGVLASALPEEEWLAFARDLISKGDHRLALRALFLASLAHLAHREFIRIAKFKSNHEYQRELSRRAHALPTLTEVFTSQIDQFERVWYGSQEATQDHVDRFLEDQERIRYSAT